MILPKNAMLFIHFVERRGSCVSPEQYLKFCHTWGKGVHSRAKVTYPATNSGHAARILIASSCCLMSSLTFNVLSTFARILLCNRPVRFFGSSSSLATTSSSASLGYHPLSLKQMPVPGRVQMPSRKWCTRLAGMCSSSSLSDCPRS